MQQERQMSQLPITIPPEDEPPTGSEATPEPTPSRRGGGAPGSPTQELTLEALALSESDAGIKVASLADESGPQDALVGAELQGGKYRVLAARSSAVGRSLLPGATARLGASYVALHTDLQKRLTLHILPLDAQASAEEREQTASQFIREVRVLARLSHPSLPLVHDYFFQSDACYVVMAELAEHTLADVLAEATQAGRVPALPPLAVARLGVELARALTYLHQQRPPLVLGGLHAEDIALPDDGPAQLVSLGALSIVASSASLPNIAPPPKPTPQPDVPPPAAPAESDPDPPLAEAEQTLDRNAPTDPMAEVVSSDAQALLPRPPDRLDDLWSLGLLLRELVGGAKVVEQVMTRRYRPEQTAIAAAPLISLALAAVIEMATQENPALRFQNAAAQAHALERAYVVEQRIARQLARGEKTQTIEVELPPYPQTPDQEELATRQFAAARSSSGVRPALICWKCGARNRPSAQVCRVCGAPQPTTPSNGQPRPRRRTTRHLADEAGREAWWEAETLDMPRPRRSRPPGSQPGPEARYLAGQPRRPSAPLPRQAPAGRRGLWVLVWLCFLMALLLGSTSALVAYRALH